MSKTKALEKLAEVPAHFQEEATTEQAVEGIDYGIVVLPPVLDEHNEELESYPEDYIHYAQDRLRAYKEEHGELPKYSKGTEK